MISSSLSGIRAAVAMIEASAGNTANANTNGYRKKTVALNEGDKGGVVASVKTSTSPGISYADTYGNVFEASTVDYAEEAVNQMTAKHMLYANIATLKTVDEMEKSVIDILA
ncbi:MAG: hypothetical protein HY955_01865 [Deltaproteobacteria bacterium]|nr:hypothetical protein [Deltaproteobacteria bacterium]